MITTPMITPILPRRARLRAGTRVLDPFSGSYFKHGGKWVRPLRWTEDGQIVCRWRPTWNPEPLYFLLPPAALGLIYRAPEQQTMFKERF